MQGFNFVSSQKKTTKKLNFCLPLPEACPMKYQCFRKLIQHLYIHKFNFSSECDVLVPGIVHFFGGMGTSIRKNWYRKKVSEPVSVKFGIGKKSRNRYRENLVPKKVPVSVSKIFGTGKKYRYRYRLSFWVPSYTIIEVNAWFVFFCANYCIASRPHNRIGCKDLLDLSVHSKINDGGRRRKSRNKL